MGMAAEFFLYEEIGYWGMTSKMFADELDAIGPDEDIVLRINSPGGDVFDGFAMYNLLIRRSSKVAVEIDGLAASAASIVAMAGDTIEMAANASMMIHGAWTVTVGGAAEHELALDRLTTIGEQIRDVYSSRRGIEPTTVQEWMDAETWWTADEAVAAGMADIVVGAAAVAAMATKPPWIHRLPAAFDKLPNRTQIVPPHKVSAAQRQRELTLRRKSLGLR